MKREYIETFLIVFILLASFGCKVEDLVGKIDMVYREDAQEFCTKLVNDGKPRLGCAQRHSFGKWTIYLPPNPPAWLVAHEMCHVQSDGKGTCDDINELSPTERIQQFTGR